jgi:lysozyme family protein
MPLPLPEAFIRFIGTAEVLGALGLILPGLTHIRTGLTPLAALGLVVVATSGAVYQLAAQQPVNAVLALIIALLAGIVAYGRWRVKPLSSAHIAALEAVV